MANKECPVCHGVSWRPAREGATGVVRCDCWLARVVANRMKAANLPIRYHDADFGLTTYGNPMLKKAVKRARTFAEAFPVVERGLIFTGPSGIGKTRLATAILRRVIERTRLRALFYDTGTLLNTIKGTYDDESGQRERDVLRPVVDADLLVLDNLGGERITSWVQEILTVIINSRYNGSLPVVVTRNHVQDNSRSDPLAAADQRLGEPILSRLEEMCELVDYRGLDFRRVQENDEKKLDEQWMTNARNPDRRRRGQKAARDGRERDAHERNRPGRTAATGADGGPNDKRDQHKES